MIIEWEGWNCGDQSTGNLQSKVRKSGPEWKSKLIPILASQSVKRGGGCGEDDRVMIREMATWADDFDDVVLFLYLNSKQFIAI